MDRIIINHKSKCVRVWCGGKNAKQIYFSATEYGLLNSAFLAAVEYKKSYLLPDVEAVKNHDSKPTRITRWVLSVFAHAGTGESSRATEHTGLSTSTACPNARPKTSISLCMVMRIWTERSCAGSYMRERENSHPVQDGRCFQEKEFQVLHAAQAL